MGSYQVQSLSHELSEKAARLRRLVRILYDPFGRQQKPPGVIKRIIEVDTDEDGEVGIPDAESQRDRTRGKNSQLQVRGR